MIKSETLRTGIECLRGIALVFCQGINFDALLDGELLQEYAETPEKGSGKALRTSLYWSRIKRRLFHSMSVFRIIADRSYAD